MNSNRNILLTWLVFNPWWSALLMTSRGNVPEQSWEYDLGVLANDGVIWEGNSLNIVLPTYLPSSVTGNVHHRHLFCYERQFFLCFVKSPLQCTILKENFHWFEAIWSWIWNNKWFEYFWGCYEKYTWYNWGGKFLSQKDKAAQRHKKIWNS